MGLFPEIAVQPNAGFVSTFSPECEGGYNVTIGGGAGASTAITQNRIYLATVRIETPVTFVAMGWLNGATSNGNCAAGIYTLTGTRLDYTAHTAQGTVSTTQAAALTNANVLLRSGLYYWAFGSDSATATFMAGGSGLSLSRIWGLAQVAGAYANPLPTSLTPAWPLGSGIQPFVFASTVAVQ